MTYNDDNQLHLDDQGLTSPDQPVDVEPSSQQPRWQPPTRSWRSSHSLAKTKILRRQREVRSEDAHACPREVPRGQADCACLQRRRNEGKNGQAQSRKRAEEAALLGLMQTWSGLGRGFNQLRTPSPDVVEVWKPFWGSIVAPRGPASRRCSLSWLDWRWHQGRKWPTTSLGLKEYGWTFKKQARWLPIRCSAQRCWRAFLQLLRASRRFSTSDDGRATKRWSRTSSTSPSRGQSLDWRGFNCLPLKRGNSRRKITCFKCQKNGLHGKGLQVKGKQGVLQVQCGGPSCKELQEQEGAVQWQQQRSREQGIFSFRSVERLQRKKDSSYWWTRVHAEGQGFLQGTRRGIQHRCAQCERESNTRGW